MGGQACDGLVGDAALVAKFMAEQGARRFERGASGDVQNLRLDLMARGYEVKMGKAGSHFIVTYPGGRPVRRLTREGFFELVDQVRCAEGREPLMGRAS